MTSNLLLNQVTKKQLESFKSKPSHALMLVGASGAGKHSLGREIAAGLLAIELERLDNQPFFFSTW